ncbi:hypothetical protein ACFSUS_28110 [Spirosoma soli]|uniref:Uncharacterized protein n=1 Tax=Spirosoma soli TaxID=1770529 RepID=A0ABW5MDS7_9BACT
MENQTNQNTPDQPDDQVDGVYDKPGLGHSGTENDDKRSVPKDGPSGENTKNNGERGGGLWTSGGKVTAGTPYHGEYGKPKPDREATTEDE